MTRGDWVILAIAAPAWVWLFKQILSRDGFLEKELPWCSGCQRHWVKPGCPVHDDEMRKAA